MSYYFFSTKNGSVPQMKNISIVQQKKNWQLTTDRRKYTVNIFSACNKSEWYIFFFLESLLIEESSSPIDKDQYRL